MSDDREVRVWDRFVRLFHWGVAGGFAVSYLSGGVIEKPHVFMGLYHRVIVAGAAGLGILWAAACEIFRLRL